MKPKKGILIFPADAFRWLGSAWEDHPWYFPILGRSLGELYQSIFSSYSVTHLRILSDAPEPQQLEPWITWKYSSLEGPTVRLLQDNRLFWQDGPTLVLRAPAFFFDFWNKAEQPIDSSSLVYQGELSEDPLRPYILLDQHRLALLVWEYLPVASVSDLFFLSQILLKGSCPDHLTGVEDSEAGGVFRHRGVRIPSNAQLGPGVFLGSGTRLGKNCKITRSLVYGDLSLGNDVVLENKLVIGKRIFSPGRGTGLDITDSGIIKVRR